MKFSSALEEFPSNFPEFWEETLRYRLLQVLPAQGASRTRCSGPDYSLDELNVQKAPHRETLLVLQQALCQHLQWTLVLLGVNLLQRNVMSGEELVEKLLRSEEH